ncbi:WbuC family cupin fold metalloprotein [Chitinibacter sp. ZOR0017]|uniref:WbuC family cupin fold metalloprotein n=1 Tax=Chitinibacter sp. ZOR0017 TaxID=1339254 RepID=UPI0006458798|nr:WbuC family cupin fold metalloprotein [Chitinibacter sp. ZOR0017]
MPHYSLLDQTLLTDLLAEAAASPRLRKNRNFHAGDDAACHRLANALQPGTYVQPHRHLNPAKAESMLMLAGELGVLIFAPDGQVEAKHHLRAGGEQFGINIEAGTFHAVVALTPCVFFEAKAGPYVPVAPAELAAWAPPAGAAESEAYLAWMRAQFA